MRRLSIKTAILIPSLAVLVVGIVTMTAIVGIASFNNTQNLTERLVEARVNEYTNEFRAISGDTYGAVTALAPIIENLAVTSENPREDILQVLLGTLEGGNSIHGIWTVWEPNALDGKDRDYAQSPNHDATGRFVPYIYRDGNRFVTEPLTGYDDPVEGEFYLAAKNSGKIYVTDPYYEHQTGGAPILIYTITIPILQNDRFVGAVGVDVSMQDLIVKMNAGLILNDGYIFTLSPSGLVATHSSDSLLMTRYDATWMDNYKTQVEEIFQNGGRFSLKAYSDVTDSHVQFLGQGVVIGDTGRNWVVCGVVPTKTVNASSYKLLFTIILIGVALIVLVGLTIYSIVRNRLRDLPVLTETAEAMALGDIRALDVHVDLTAETKNEVTLLAKAFLAMADGIKEQAAVLSSVAGCDYSVGIPVRSEADLMNKAIVDMLNSTNTVMLEVQRVSSQVSYGASQIADGAQTLASGSVQQAATVEEFSASIAQILTQAESSSSLAQAAKNQTDQVGVHMNESMVNMSELSGAMSEINARSQEIVRFSG